MHPRRNSRKLGQQMADVFSKAKRSRVMAAIRSKGNKSTEMIVARIFLQNGVKEWRRHQKMTGNPDFVFRKEHVVVFVDGCFWHGCVYHCRIPASNRSYWRRKISRNAARDKMVTKQLEAAGWTVIRVWEHSLRNARRVAQSVMDALAVRPSLKHTSPRNWKG